MSLGSWTRLRTLDLETIFFLWEGIDWVDDRQTRAGQYKGSWVFIGR